MPAAKKAAASNGTAKKRNTVELPSAIRSEPAEWPGSNRGQGSANAELRKQLEADAATMSLGDARDYYIAGEDQQKSLVSLFRKAVDTVWVDSETGEPSFGVQVSFNAEKVTVKISDRVKRAKKQAATEATSS